MSLKVGVGTGRGGACFSLPVCVSIYVFSTSIKSACLVASVQVRARLCCCGLPLVTPPSKGGFHQCGQNHRRPVIVHERSFVKCLPHNG